MFRTAFQTFRLSRAILLIVAGSQLCFCVGEVLAAAAVAAPGKPSAPAAPAPATGPAAASKSNAATTATTATATPTVEAPEIDVGPVVVAALAGDRYSQMAMGVLYEQRGSFTNAARWFRLAAEQNVPEAQFKMGFYYSTARGVLRNYDEAASWYFKAAQAGLPDAQYNIGVCFEHGLGLPQSHSEALTWYREAAEGDNPGAQKALGVLYERGKGVKIDLVEAAVWYSLAEKRGLPEAVALKKHLAPMLTKEQFDIVAERVKKTELKITERRNQSIARAAAGVTGSSAAAAALAAKPPGTNAPALPPKSKGKDFLE